MSSVMLLSSPPNTFARSPTPFESSSPLPSPHTLLTSQLSQQTPKKFRTANVQRDGFSGGFSSARSLLGTKIGAENVPIRSSTSKEDALSVLSPKRFKSTTAVAGSTVADNLLHREDPIDDEDLKKSGAASSKAPGVAGSLKRFNSAPARSLASEKGTTQMQKTPGPNSDPTITKGQDDPFELPDSPLSTYRGIKPQARQEDIPTTRHDSSALNLEMAVSRRTDWTPTKDVPTIDIDDSPSIRLLRSFSGGLLHSFGYSGDTAVVTPLLRHDINSGPTKRRRLDRVETGVMNASSRMPPPKTPTIKKPKTAPKKPLTITGLATSNYLGKDGRGDDSTLLDKFLSTQALALEAGHDDITSEIAKVKAVKKRRALKRTVRKSTLVSPTTAIKALENQDALFGSASQLARDESPSLIRDTLEAIKKSESYNFSSPIRTQDTEPISIDSTTPRATTGITRFIKTRGLWAAAGRDGDNALLHVDTIDIDSLEKPDLRQAFPGKDVLVQPSASLTRGFRSPEKKSPSLRGGGSLHPYGENFWDIDELETPLGPPRSTGMSKTQLRAFHTTASTESPRKRAPTPPSDNVEPFTEMATTKTAKTAKKRTPKKPAFAGLTTEKLQKQIATYGFKPMKTREQMIAVLEKCWEQKHGQPEKEPAAQREPGIEKIDDPLKHGDYLSNVHGLANRPAPKEKKVPKPRKPKEPQEPQEPKPRKKREPKATKEKGPNTAKAVRKRKTKATLTEENIADVDDLGPADGKVLMEAAAIAFADAVIERATARRKLSAKAKAHKPAKAVAKTQAERSATSRQALSPAFETPEPLAEEATIPTITSSPEAIIDAQIECAITSYQAPPSTNHQREPTWHEKILLYDPIVLEDLASWLNTVGLGAIGEDCEVSALEVREWCERRGVCCLWRGGWRGYRRYRVGKIRKEDE